MSVPGLLQTDDYAAAIAEALLRSPEEVDRYVQARKKRQERLERDDAPAVWAIMEEASLVRLRRWPELMRGQIDRLLDTATAPGPVTLQMVTLDAGMHPGSAGSFVILRFNEAPTIVYAETLTDGLYLERSGEIDLYAHAFDHLRGFALSTRETIARLRELRP